MVLYNKLQVDSELFIFVIHRVMCHWFRDGYTINWLYSKNNINYQSYVVGGSHVVIFHYN